MKKKAAIILNGPILDVAIEEEYIICADGGSRHLSDRKPDIVIGDFDSSAFTTDVNTRVFPAHKDVTDGVLCVDYAKTQGFEEITLYSAHGGRFDHEISNLSLLEYAHKQGLNAVINTADYLIYYKASSFSLKTRIGKTLSLISFSGCKFNNAIGLEYSIDDLTLNFGNAFRGISNKAIAEEIFVSMATGSVFVFVEK